MGFTALNIAFDTMNRFAAALKLGQGSQGGQGDKSFVRKVVYTAMTLYHIFLKAIDQASEGSQGSKVNYDIKMVALACLRVSAVWHDVELKVEHYTRTYYESAVKDFCGRPAAVKTLNLKQPGKSTRSQPDFQSP